MSLVNPCSSRRFGRVSGTALFFVRSSSSSSLALGSAKIRTLHTTPRVSHNVSSTNQLTNRIATSNTSSALYTVPLHPTTGISCRASVRLGKRRTAALLPRVFIAGCVFCFRCFCLHNRLKFACPIVISFESTKFHLLLLYPNKPTNSAATAHQDDFVRHPQQRWQVLHGIQAQQLVGEGPAVGEVLREGGQVVRSKGHPTADDGHVPW